MKQVSYFIFIFIAQFVLIKEKRPVEGGGREKKKKVMSSTGRSYSLMETLI